MPGVRTTQICFVHDAKYTSPILEIVESCTTTTYMCDAVHHMDGPKIKIQRQYFLDGACASI